MDFAYLILYHDRMSRIIIITNCTNKTLKDNILTAIILYVAYIAHNL